MPSFLKYLLNGIVDFVIPRICVHCEKEINHDNFLCEACMNSLGLIPHVDDYMSFDYYKLYPEKIIGLFRFEENTPVKSLLHSLKYEKMQSLGLIFGSKLGVRIRSMVDESYDLLVPVPLHLSKKRERTYNQSLAVCRGLQKSLGVPIVEDLLKRTRYTKSQTKLNTVARAENVVGAFILREKYKFSVAGKNIILVDDVITTGATIVECARVLRNHGCSKIIISSIAVAY